MENKKYDLTVNLGILAIIGAFIFNGVPVGKEGLVLGYFILFVVLNFSFILIGLFVKNDKAVTIYSFIVATLVLATTALVENNIDELKITVLGWLTPFIYSVIGLYKIYNTNKKDRNKLAVVLNIIGLILSLASLIVGLVQNGGFIVK